MKQLPIQIDATYIRTSEANGLAGHPNFVAGIKAMFEPWQRAQFLNTPRRLGVQGHTADVEEHRLLRAEWEKEERIWENARNLMLLEWAKELLVEDAE